MVRELGEERAFVEREAAHVHTIKRQGHTQSEGASLALRTAGQAVGVPTPKQAHQKEAAPQYRDQEESRRLEASPWCLRPTCGAKPHAGKAAKDTAFCRGPACSKASSPSSSLAQTWRWQCGDTLCLSKLRRWRSTPCTPPLPAVTLLLRSKGVRGTAEITQLDGTDHPGSCAVSHQGSWAARLSIPCHRQHSQRAGGGHGEEGNGVRKKHPPWGIEGDGLTGVWSR